MLKLQVKMVKLVQDMGMGRSMWEPGPVVQPVVQPFVQNRSGRSGQLAGLLGQHGLLDQGSPNR